MTWEISLVIDTEGPAQPTDRSGSSRPAAEVTSRGPVYPPCRGLVHESLGFAERRLRSRLASSLDECARVRGLREALSGRSGGRRDQRAGILLVSRARTRLAPSRGLPSGERATAMKPWREADRAVAPGGGDLVLLRRGGEYVIRVDGDDLMGSSSHSSEEQLAEHGLSNPSLFSQSRPGFRPQ